MEIVEINFVLLGISLFCFHRNVYCVVLDVSYKFCPNRLI